MAGVERKFFLCAVTRHAKVDSSSEKFFFHIISGAIEEI